MRALLARNHARGRENRSNKARPRAEWTSLLDPGMFRLCHSVKRYYGWPVQPTAILRQARIDSASMPGSRM